MTFIDSLLRRIGYVHKSQIPVFTPSSMLESHDWQSYYSMLWRYYENNGLYELPDMVMRRTYMGDTVRSLRNPANRAVEFYAATICPGSLDEGLPIVTDNSSIVEPIRQLWRWSNWGESRFVSIRHFAAYGDAYIKVSQLSDGRPYLQLIVPETVVELKEDHRGNITYIRIDTLVEVNGKNVKRVEIWSEDEGLSIWENAAGLSDPLKSEPTVRASLNEMGIDFIPIVHAKFRNTGKLLGTSCFVHVLDKIDEVNRVAWRLNATAFRNNKTLWALLANGQDKDGRPLPPVSIKGADGTTDINIAALERDTMIRLPGYSKLESLVPALPYGDFLSVILSAMDELEQDLPEIRYWKVMEGNETGRAVEKKLMPAISRAVEARSSWETALIRAQKMALTLGVAHGIWKNMGSFEKGDLEHLFAKRAVLPINLQDRGEEERAVWEAVISSNSAHCPPEIALFRLGFNSSDILKISKNIEKEKEKADVQGVVQTTPKMTPASAPPSDTGVSK